MGVFKILYIYPRHAEAVRMQFCESKKTPAEENHDKNAEAAQFQWVRALKPDVPAAVTEREAGEFMVEVFMEYRSILEMMRRVDFTVLTQHQGAEEQEHSKQFTVEEIKQLQSWLCFCANAVVGPSSCLVALVLLRTPPT